MNNMKVFSTEGGAWIYLAVLGDVVIFALFLWLISDFKECVGRCNMGIRLLARNKGKKRVLFYRMDDAHDVSEKFLSKNW